MHSTEKQPLVLIVDDELINRELLETVVERLGYQSEIACDGPQALAMLKPEIDLVLLDVNMPGMTGFDMVRAMRQNPAYADVPVIMVTALNSKEDRLEAVRAGANDFIAKPIDMTEVKVRTAAMLRMKFAQDALKRHQEELERIVETRTRSLQEAMDKMAALATTDTLTGLPNHRALVAALDQEVERVQRFNRSCALLFLDIDHFKALNDSCGHAIGDAALKEFSEVVYTCLRGMDTLGRWVGEEFLILMPETDEEEALTAAERIRQAVAQHVFAAAGGGHLTCSIGLAVCPQNAADRSTLVAAADYAMYAAKRLGRNQVRKAADPAVAALGDRDDPVSREEAALRGVVEALSQMVEIRDQYTGEHTDDVAALSQQIALTLGLNEGEARMVSMVGKLHDIGKVGVTDLVLHKPGNLTPEEWVIMRQHPVIGADVVSCLPSLRVVVPAIRGHHEHWDGSGYPDGLKGDKIPLAARIVAVADAFSAMTTNRPYRQAHGIEWALSELKRGASTQFDPNIVEALERLIQRAEPILLPKAA